MSATNRGAVRRAYDFYETPEEITREFLFEHFKGDFHVILEPCAGSGKMVKVLRDRFPLAWIEANDIQDGSIPYANKRYTLDFLKMGRSPRMRGKRMIDLARRSGHRSIPAHAG